MSISFLQHTQGLQGFQLHSFEYDCNFVIATISKKKNKLQCFSCKSFNVTATYIRDREIQGLPCGTKSLLLKVKTHRLRCHDCRAYRMENLHFLSSSSARITKRFERTVVDLRAEMSIKAVANYFNLHWETVKNIEKKHLKKNLKKVKLSTVKTIGIDEIHMGKTIGKKGFLTIVRDLDSGAVLFIGDGKKGDCLDDFQRKLKRAKAKIETVAVDMAASFTAWVKKNLPKATIVYDHFHVIKLANTKVNQVRRRTMKELAEQDKKALKNRRWLFNRNQENLGNKEWQDLQTCKDMFSELGASHYLKECLRSIYRLADSKELADLAFKQWTEIADNSEIPEILTLSKTIKKYINGILAYWSTGGVTSASMEGFNNKIGWLTRQAYGYRDQEYLKLKIYDLPNLKIAKAL